MSSSVAIPISPSNRQSCNIGFGCAFGFAFCCRFSFMFGILTQCIQTRSGLGPCNPQQQCVLQTYHSHITSGMIGHRQTGAWYEHVGSCGSAAIFFIMWDQTVRLKSWVPRTLLRIKVRRPWMPQGARTRKPHHSPVSIPRRLVEKRLGCKTCDISTRATVESYVQKPFQGG